MNSSLKKMDDFTINKILLLNKVTKDSFIGVFSSDTLPSYAQTGYYVVNLDTSQQPGSHWIAIKISKSKCKNEYFDSYGLGPPTVRFKRFMKYNYIYNSKRITTLPFHYLCPVVHILHMEKVSRMELERYTKTFL